MSLPTLNKTWLFKVNQLVLSQGSTNATHARMIRVIKNCMTTFSSNPWTVSGSSNAGGTTGSPTGAGALDGVDRWTTDTDINTGGSNSRHAWIVLRQTGIATNYEVCFDLNSTGTISSWIMAISPSAGFTGGSATARPTATDEIVMVNSGAWGSGADAQHQIHVWQSSDGQCTRIIIWRAGTNLCQFMLFDKPQNAVSGWTNPSVTSVYTTTTGIAMTYASLSTSGTSQGRGSTAFTIRYSGEGDTSGLLPNTANVGFTPNEFDGTYPFYPIGIYSITASHRGRHGNLFDLWWRSASISDGDTFPSSPTARQFVCMGPLILPWPGDSTIPLLA